MVISSGMKNYKPFVDMDEKTELASFDVQKITFL